MKTKIEQQGIRLILEMTEVEASVLMTILGNVGGPPGGVRKVADSIHNTLADHGITSGRLDDDSGVTILPDSWEEF